MTPLHLSHSRIPTFPHSLSPHGVKGFRRGVLDNAWRLASLSFIYTPTPSNHAIAERVNPHGYCCASLRVIGERRRVRFCALWRVRTAVSPSSLACKIKSRVSPTCKRLCTTLLLHKLATTLSETRAHSRAKGPVVVACGFCARHILLLCPMFSTPIK